jgi:polyhydroxyalkanoate synthesis regulator protein
MIQQGFDLRVIDARTSADITAQVLTQIILELDTPKLDSLPVPLLVRIIRMNDQLVKDFIDKYFNQALKSFLDYQQNVEEQFRRTHGLPTVFPSVSAWTKAIWEPFTSALTGTATPSEKPAEASGAPATAEAAADLRQVVRDLQQQVAELKQQQPPAGKRSRARTKA